MVQVESASFDIVNAPAAPKFPCGFPTRPAVPGAGSEAVAAAKREKTLIKNESAALINVCVRDKMSPVLSDFCSPSPLPPCNCWMGGRGIKEPAVIGGCPEATVSEGVGGVRQSGRSSVPG